MRGVAWTSGPARGACAARSSKLSKIRERQYYDMRNRCTHKARDAVPGKSGEHSLGQRAEFVAEELRRWLAKAGTGTRHIEPETHRENGYCESFTGNLRGECLTRPVEFNFQHLGPKGPHTNGVNP